MSEEISTEKKTSNTLVTIVMVVVGVILVLLVGVLVGKALTPAPEGPPVNLPAPPSFSGPYAVAGAAINVRSGPGTEFPRRPSLRSPQMAVGGRSACRPRYHRMGKLGFRRIMSSPTTQTVSHLVTRNPSCTRSST